MLEVARGLLLDPKLILIDEPSIGLSPLMVQEVFAILKSLARQRSDNLLIEQNAKQALQISDYGLVLEQGQTRIEDTAPKILADPRIDRLPHDEGKTFHPDLIMLGGEGDPKLGDALKGAQVTAKVSAHVLGKKVIVGKHLRHRAGYRRRNGHRSRLSQIEIQSIGKKATRSTTAKKTASTTAKKEES